MQELRYAHHAKLGNTSQPQDHRHASLVLLAHTQHLQLLHARAAQLATSALLLVPRHHLTASHVLLVHSASSGRAHARHAKLDSTRTRLAQLAARHAQLAGTKV